MLSAFSVIVWWDLQAHEPHSKGQGLLGACCWASLLLRFFRRCFLALLCEGNQDGAEAGMHHGVTWDPTCKWRKRAWGHITVGCMPSSPWQWALCSGSSSPSLTPRARIIHRFWKCFSPKSLAAMPCTTLPLPTWPFQLHSCCVPGTGACPEHPANALCPASAHPLT